MHHTVNFLFLNVFFVSEMVDYDVDMSGCLLNLMDSFSGLNSSIPLYFQCSMIFNNQDDLYSLKFNIWRLVSMKIGLRHSNTNIWTNLITITCSISSINAHDHPRSWLKQFPKLSTNQTEHTTSKLINHITQFNKFCSTL